MDRHSIAADRRRFPSNRKRNMTALVGSTVTALLLVYEISRFVAFRLGYVHARGQLGAFRPNTFDRVNQIQIVTKPLLLLFLISSLASLLISALITLRLRNRTGSSPFIGSTPD